MSAEEFDEKLEQILSGDEWIVDGNYLRTLPRRLQECDTVFFFDIPVDECLAGAIDRLGKPREDMPWTDTDIDEDFRRWILDFPSEQRPQIVRLLESFGGNVFCFKSRKEADDYLNHQL